MWIDVVEQRSLRQQAKCNRKSAAEWFDEPPMLLALPISFQIRQLPALSARPLQWRRQRIKRSQRIRLQREVWLACFKCSCRLHHERWHFNMLLSPASRALRLNDDRDPRLESLGYFQSSADADGWAA